MNLKPFVIITIPIALCSCSSMVKSVGLGLGIGATSGFTASKFAQYNTKGTLVLTASGAIIGGVIAALIHKDPPSESSQLPASFLNGNAPPLQDAKTDVMWIPDSVQDGKYIEGHKIWNIQSPAYWQLQQAAKEEQTTEDKDNGKKRDENKENHIPNSSQRKK